MSTLIESLHHFPVLYLGVGASVAASLGTGAGALPVFAVRRVSQRAEDALQSLAAGIMLAAAVLSLVVPGIESGAALFGSAVWGALAVSASLLLGALAVLFVHRHAPHEHFVSGLDGPAARRLKGTWLFVVAITLHNFPEGLAVGVGFGGGEVANGLALGTAIFLQNLPEGFLVALGLVAAGYRRGFSVLVACVTGFVETVGGLAGAIAVTVAAAVLPWAMGFAAGAMLFIISHEIVPETHRNGNESVATFGLLGGFVLMTLIDVVMG